LATLMKLNPAQSVSSSESASSATTQTPVGAQSTAISPWQIFAIVTPLLLVGVIYWGTFRELIQVWDEDPNYSHGFVVPFFALGLAWIAYQRTGVFPVGNQVDRRSAILGGIEIGAGFALHLFAMFLGRKFGLFFDVAALIFMLRGAVLTLGGPAANAAYSFPLLFLIFMAPLPAQVYEPIALRMQAIASIVAAGLLDFVGVPVLREGYVIQIPGHTMEVVGACSGMRSLTAILALAMAIGYLSGRGQAYRWILGILAAPVAIGVNCLRVFGTGMIMLNFGKEWATGAAHEGEGMIMLVFATLLLAGLAWLLALIEDTYFTQPHSVPLETPAQRAAVSVAPPA
jgi:exosortase